MTLVYTVMWLRGGRPRTAAERGRVTSFLRAYLVQAYLGAGFTLVLVAVMLVVAAYSRNAELAAIAGAIGVAMVALLAWQRWWVRRSLGKWQDEPGVKD